MQPDQATQLAENLIAQYAELAGWRLELNGQPVRRLDLCIYGQKAIQLSTRFVQLNEEPRIVETTRHEIAHALVGPGHGHDVIWKRTALLVGCQPIRCATNVILPLGKWIAVCSGCRRVYTLHRTPRKERARWCKKCGRVSGLLLFVPNDNRLEVAMRLEAR